MITKQDTIYEWIQNGQLEDALKALFQNIEEEPNTIENYINAGMTAAELDKNQDAEFQYGLALCHLEMFNQAINQLKLF